jgi:hypothetical protein
MDGPLKASIGEIQAHRREQLARRQGATSTDLEASRETGFDSCDVVQLRLLTLELPCLLVFRCPKLASRWLHGVAPAKTWRLSDLELKSGPSGGLVHEGRVYVSDYDLMCVYRVDPSGRDKPTKVMASGIDASNPRSPLSREASELFRLVNRRLVTKLQHGAQDDWASPDNPGVDLAAGRFAAVWRGVFRPLRNGHDARAFYAEHGLDWPYDHAGRHRAARG